MRYTHSPILIGFDAIELNRIQHSLAKSGNTFLQRILTQAEIELCYTKGRTTTATVNRIGTQFSGKEAIAKMLGTGIREIGWRDIEILREESGRPYVQLYNKAEKRAQELNIISIDISLCQTRETAYAVALGQRKAVKESI